jgi:FkbM family methyltransferase
LSARVQLSDPILADHDETFVPHVGWLRHPTGDDVATYLRQGWFEYREMALLWLYLRPGDAMIDCGAHVGLFSVLAHHATGGRGRIIAVEPDPGTLPLLRANLQAHGAAAVEVVEAAVWSAHRQLVLHAQPRDRAAYSSVVIDAPGGADVPVQAVTIDALLQERGVEHAALLKLDVEGAEAEAWRGAARAAAAGRLPLVMVEFTEANQRAAGRSTADLGRAWTEAGYRLHHFDPRRLELVPADLQRPVSHDNLFAAVEAAPINRRLAESPPGARRIAREILARGAAAFALLKRACDAEHALEAEPRRFDEMQRRAGHYARYIHNFTWSLPMRLLRALRLVNLPDFIGQVEEDRKRAQG